jgi:hypothetical protein
MPPSTIESQPVHKRRQNNRSPALLTVSESVTVNRVRPSVPPVLWAYRGPTERQLVGHPVEQEGFQGVSQEHDVQPYRLVAHVVSVHPNPLAVEGVVASGDLQWAGASRRDAQ